MDENKMKERRRHPRYDVRYTAKVWYENESLCGTVINISKGGVGILLPRIMEKGSVLQIEIESILGGEEIKHIKCKAKIVWLKEKEFLPGMFRAGLEIVEISDQDRNILDNHIKSLEKNLESK